MVSNLKELMVKFSDEAQCRAFLVQQRWDGSPVCPYCKCEKWYSIEGGKRFKCGNSCCYKKYSVTVGTIFHASNIPLTTWFPAMYLITAHKKGISSVQLAKDLGVTQKTAWFMLHRIRESLKDKGSDLLTGMVEVDETYVGGRMKNRHKKTRNNRNLVANENKTAVIGMVSREGKLKTEVMPLKNDIIMNIVKKHVDTQAQLITDGAGAYYYAHKDYAKHEIIYHSKDEFVRGVFHTNTIEGFFAYLKRSIFGIYHQVSPKHLQAYCNENAYRYNLREMKDGERFIFSLSQISGKLSYKTLIGK
jgi:hypothetical protein